MDIVLLFYVDFSFIRRCYFVQNNNAIIYVKVAFTPDIHCSKGLRIVH